MRSGNLCVGVLVVALGLGHAARGMRWLGALAPAALAACGRYAKGVATGTPDERLSPADVQQLFAALTSRVREGGPNHLHCRRLYYYAQTFAPAAGADVDVVAAAAILHDATKEDGRGDPVERFCTHGAQGAAYARDTLHALGKSDGFADRVAQAIAQHMGPRGWNWRFLHRRFMSKYCPHEDFSNPTTREAQVLYDIDMLDLMTVDGVVKVVTLRQGPGFAPEPIRDSAKLGRDSAWKSVIDASQTLITRPARACGRDLVAHTAAFLAGVDWAEAETPDAFARVAARYLRAHPLPTCLPRVPPLA